MKEIEVADFPISSRSTARVRVIRDGDSDPKIDIRRFTLVPDRNDEVPTKSGIRIPAAMIPELRAALIRAETLMEAFTDE